MMSDLLYGLWERVKCLVVHLQALKQQFCNVAGTHRCALQVELCSSKS